MKLKISIPLLCAATGLTIMHAALAADLSRGDERFLRKAAESGMLEIQASELAAQKAQHPEVKKYAEMMLKDHSAADKELKALAASKGFELPVELEGGKKRLIDKLRDREGADFDDEYVDEVAVDAHEDAVDLFEDAADDAKDADIKAFAAKTLPTLQKHLDAGRQLEDMLDDDDDRENNRGDRPISPSRDGMTQGGATTVPGTSPGVGTQQ